MVMSHDEYQEHCSVLSISGRLTRQIVETAYREMAGVWHPDRVHDSERKAKNTERLKRINAAKVALLTLLAHFIDGLLELGKCTTLGRPYFVETSELLGGVILPREFRTLLERYLSGD